MYYKILLEPLPRLTEIYYVKRNTTWRCADKNNLLIFVKEGCCYFTVNAEETLVSAGKAILVPSNTPYVRKAYNDTMCTLCYIHFRTQEPPQSITDEEMLLQVSKIFENDFLSSLKNADAPDNDAPVFLSEILDFSSKHDELFRLLDGIRDDEFKADNPYRQINASLSLVKLLISFSHTSIKNVNDYSYTKNTSFPLSLQKALIYIQKNYRKKLSTSGLAALSGISEQQLIRLFKAYLNATPIEYVNKIKIFHAIDMLRHTEMSIKEISYELGFDDPNYFSRLFKKEEKMSPKATRNRICNYEIDKLPSPVK